MPLAALGIISPIVAAATMATSGLLVVGNSPCVHVIEWDD